MNFLLHLYNSCVTLSGYETGRYETVRIFLSIIFILVCIALTVIVLAQEGKDAGLGALGGGQSDTYWGKNKSRSMEGNLVRFTKYLAIAFIVLAIILNLNF